MNKKSAYIIASVLVFSIAVDLIDAVVQPNYFLKIPIKIIFFLALPMSFFVVNKKSSGNSKKYSSLRKAGY